MFIGSFAMYSAYLADEQKRVAQFRQRSMERRRHRRPLNCPAPAVRAVRVVKLLAPFTPATKKDPAF